MWGVELFSENIDEGGAYTEIATVPTQTTKAIGDYLYIGKQNKILAAFALMGIAAQGSPYMDSPSLRRICPCYIHPVISFQQATSMTQLSIDPTNLLSLSEGEGLKLLSNANPTAAEYHSVMVMLTDTKITPVGGEIFTLLGTATITGVVGSWSSGNITFAQDLPVGRYQMVGASVFGVNMSCFRFIFNTQTTRPGFLASSAQNLNLHPAQRFGQLGVWGEYHSLTPPQLEFHCIAACTAQYVYIDIVKVG